MAHADWTRWASATFTGARHRIVMRAGTSPLLNAWLAGLSEAEFALRRHLLADIAVTQVDRHDGWTEFCLEALTVEER
nr:hypothetical protein [Sphingomonas xinjiangensis]